MKLTIPGVEIQLPKINLIRRERINERGGQSQAVSDRRLDSKEPQQLREAREEYEEFAPIFNTATFRNTNRSALDPTQQKIAETGFNKAIIYIREYTKSNPILSPLSPLFEGLLGDNMTKSGAEFLKDIWYSAHVKDGGAAEIDSESTPQENFIQSLTGTSRKKLPAKELIEAIQSAKFDPESNDFLIKVKNNPILSPFVEFLRLYTVNKQGGFSTEEKRSDAENTLKVGINQLIREATKAAEEEKMKPVPTIKDEFVGY